MLRRLIDGWGYCLDNILFMCLFWVWGFCVVLDSVDCVKDALDFRNYSAYRFSLGSDVTGLVPEDLYVPIYD